MLELLISLGGIICGYLLTYIAPEEIDAGQRYFLFLKRSLWVILALTSLFFFIKAQNILWGILFFLALGILFTITLFWKHVVIEIVNYITFLSIILLSQKEAQLLLASVVFLYGLPAGTLLKHDLHKRSGRDH